MNVLYDFFYSLFELLNAMSPYLLLGFFFAGVLKVWFPQKWIDRYMGKSNWRSVVNTALLGIPLPLCSCGVIPTGISFYRNGASKGSSVSFLISTPQTGVDSIMVTYSLLGLPFAIIRVIVALLTGILGGAFTNYTAKNDRVNTNSITTSCNNDKMGTKGGLKRLLQYGFYEFLMDIAKWLIIGIIIAAAISVIIPDDFFIQYLDNELLSMLVILLASIPLYLCATASVPIAAVLMLKGLSPGAALVLLMAGPATNAATITIIKKVFGNKTLLSYLSSIILGAILFGLLINNFLPREWFNIDINAMSHAHKHELIPNYLKITSTIILIALIINGYIQRYLTNKKTKQKSTSVPENNTSLLNAPISPLTSQNIQFGDFSMAKPIEERIFQIEGMTCNHCKNSVETNLSKLDGINSVYANLLHNQVNIKGSNISVELMRQTIELLGYTFVKEVK